MNKHERVAAALAGGTVDRPPVSTWRHFVDREQNAADLAGAMLEYQRTYDWDWMKVNPRATYFAEAWGNTYDFSQYVSVVPEGDAGHAPVDSPTWTAIRPVDPAGGAFGEQLEALDLIRRGARRRRADHPDGVLAALGDRVAGRRPGRLRVPGLPSSLPFLQTGDRGGARGAGSGARRRHRRRWSSYARLTRAAGADGLFFAIVRLAREGYLTREEYARFGRPYDLRVLEAVADAPLNVLHICGDHVYFDAVADYPVHAISWNSEAPGNPSFGEAAAMTPAAVMGGVAEDTTLCRTARPTMSAGPCSRRSRQTGGRRTLVSRPAARWTAARPPENLLALRDAARAWHA